MLPGTGLSWPTPSAQSYGTNQGGAAGRTGKVRPSLQTLGANWPTPTAGDSKASGAAGYSTAKRNAGTTLTDAACGPRGPMSSAPGQESRPKLNPVFVEWLMGWPLGWTGFEPVATESFRSWLLRHFLLCYVVSSSNE